MTTMQTNYHHGAEREFPRLYIEHALARFGGPPPVRTIVELGSLRHALTHDLGIDLQAECCLYGHSTIHWARSGHRVFTVDIDPLTSELTRQICMGYCNVTIATGDGIKFLENFEGTIDLLYMDAWDVVPGTPFAEKHLEAFEVALPKLGAGHMILIDDTDIAEGGKGRLLVPRLLELGYTLVTSGRQTLLCAQTKEVP